MTPEGKVKKKINEWLEETFPGLFTWMPVPNGYGKSGIPDHIACVPVVITQEMVGETIGVFVGIEAKTEVGVLTKHQERRLAEIADASGIAEVVYGTGDSFNRMCESIERRLK